MSLKIKDFRSKYRHLRNFRRVAHKSHGRCQICQREIQPGDEYECDVFITKHGHLGTYKIHVMCPEDFFREIEEIHKKHEAERNKEKVSASKAA